MYLSPLVLRERYFSPVEAEIQRLFDAIIYKPLILACDRPATELQNAINALASAVAKGNVWYDAGKFKGEFSAAISKDLMKIGAIYNAPSRTWSLPRELLPAEISFAIANAEDIYQRTRRNFNATLDSIRPDSVAQHSHATEKYTHTLNELETNFQGIIEPVASTIGIPAKLTEAQRDLIATQWGQNLDLYIKDWVAEDIVALREKVQRHGLAGGRAEGLVEMLQQNYGTSRSKAKFLARQETSLLMSNFHRSRFTQAGLPEYKWSGANDARERPDHKHLNGKIFRWDDPPVTNRKTGARNNPGEDYGCRCVAIPWLG